MSRADSTARALAAQFHIDEPPVGLDHVADALGLIVIRQPSDTRLHGMLMRRDGQDVIGLNEDLPLETQRFALAHLIGHHQIHARRELILDTGAARSSHRNLPSMPTDREEAEANRFAAALLVPEPLAREAATREAATADRDLVETLAARFQTSTSVMGYRLLTLGVVMDH